MRSRTLNRSLGVALWLVAGAAVAVPPTRAEDKPVLSLRAFAVNLTAPGRSRAGTIEITLERWSTDQEREQLRDALIEKGPGALLAALQKVKPRVGFIRSSTSLGWDLLYAREEPAVDGGRRVIVATDRPMGYWELQNQPRSVEYEFTLAEIRLHKDGKGEGKLVPAAKITWNKATRTVEIEDYGTEPVRLLEVEAVGPKN